MNGMSKKELEKFIRNIVKEEVSIAILKHEMETTTQTTNIFHKIDLDSIFPDKRDYDVWCRERFEDVK